MLSSLWITGNKPGSRHPRDLVETWSPGLRAMASAHPRLSCREAWLGWSWDQTLRSHGVRRLLCSQSIRVAGRLRTPPGVCWNLPPLSPQCRQRGGTKAVKTEGHRGLANSHFAGASSGTPPQGFPGEVAAAAFQPVMGQPPARTSAFARATEEPHER